MSTSAARRQTGGLGPRLRGAWHELYAEQQLAAVAALGLIASMFLPWYQQTGFVVTRDGTEKVEDSLIAFQAWGFVEASILLVTLGVLVLLFARAERRAFHLPFGDGPVIMAAGAWTMFLVFYRQIDKPNGNESGALKTTIGVSWGIFVAFLLGALLAYAGWRITLRHRPEPVVDGDDPRTARIEGDLTSVPTPPDPRDAGVLGELQGPPGSERPAHPPVEPATSAARRRRRPGARGSDGQFEGQMSFEDNDGPDQPHG